MGNMLDRIGERLWLVWCTCIVWAALWAFLPAGYEFLAWPIAALATAILLLAIFDHLLRYAPLRDALKAQGLRGAPGIGERSLGSLQLISAAFMAASLIFDPNGEVIVPLFLSVYLPQMLKTRSDEEAFLQEAR
jgi:hypothetical protein